MAAVEPLGNAALWNRIERLAREKCAHDPMVLHDVQEQRRVWEERVAEFKRTRVPTYDTESAEEAEERLGRVPKGWVDPLPAVYAEASVGQFRPGQDPDDRIIGWVDAPTPILALGGVAGVGKTWAAAAVGNAFAKDCRCLLVTARDMFHRLRPSSADPERFRRLLRTVGLLVIDDLGTTVPSPFESAELLDVVNHRRSSHQASAPLLTVVTTNLKSEQINESWSDRMEWRLFDPPAVLVRVGRST